MDKVPYGGFEADQINTDALWLNLHQIAEALERGEPVPPKLARWLGEAIFRADKDEKKLMQNLGVIKPKGKPSLHSANDWLVYGKKICDLEDDGFSKENAIKKVAGDPEFNLEGIDRTTLQRWRNKYVEALEEVAKIDVENRE